MSQVKTPEVLPNGPLSAESRQASGRRLYRTPRLLRQGDVRSLTFGGSPGLNDSGSPTTQRFPGT